MARKTKKSELSLEVLSDTKLLCRNVGAKDYYTIPMNDWVCAVKILISILVKEGRDSIQVWNFEERWAEYDLESLKAYIEEVA